MTCPPPKLDHRTREKPRLVYTREEVAAIARRLDHADVLVGPEASEMRIDSLVATGRLGEYDIVHFATHALVDDERPERSALVLSQVGLPDPLEAPMAGRPVRRGLVRVGEVMKLWQLGDALVVLSACETGLGREVPGEGYVGFVWAFFRAGAREVVSSLWKVDDVATRLLMERLYANHLDGGMPVTEARRWLRDYHTPDGRRPFADPYYWGAFVVAGDGR